MTDCPEETTTMPFKMRHFCLKPAGHDDSEHDCLCGYTWQENLREID